MATNDATDFPINCPDMKAINEAFEKGGVLAVNTLVPQLLDKWKNDPIDVGVTGNSGVGKSSFINALRGRSADDDGAAEVGVVETTKEPKSYKHPNNERMLLWDLPGVGTPTFTQDTYLDAINVNRYDYFMILSCSRFTEIDQWLGEELKKRNKKFYFVRTKLDEDIRNDKRNHPSTHNEKKVIATIRHDCQKNLVNLVDEVYLIDNYETNTLDFCRLDGRLVSDTPELKRESILFTLDRLSESMILAKEEALMKRIPRVALLSAICGVIPVQYLGMAINIGLIRNEINFYRQQFGLSDEAKVKHAEEWGKQLKPINLSSQLPQTKDIVDYVVNIGIQKTSSKVIAIALTVLGTIATGAVSYACCYQTLKSELKKAVENAFTLSVCKK